MTTEAMKITLTTQPADARWGEKAAYSINSDGVALHLELVHLEGQLSLHAQLRLRRVLPNARLQLGKNLLDGHLGTVGNSKSR